MSDTAKRGRGRPKGSTSFVKVRLSDLNSQFGPNATICVSKKWLDGVGIEVEDLPAPSMVISSSTDEPDSEETIQFVIH